MFFDSLKTPQGLPAAFFFEGGIRAGSAPEAQYALRQLGRGQPALGQRYQIVP